MEIKFKTENDIFQFILSILLFFVLVCLKQNFPTVLIASVGVIFGYKLAFGSSLIFTNSEIIVKKNFLKKRMNYNKIKVAYFRHGFYGKSFVVLETTNDKTYKGFLSKNRWNSLIECLKEKKIPSKEL